MAEQMEQALAALDRAVEDGLKSTQKLQSALRRCAAASRAGVVRDIDTAIGAVIAASAELARKADGVRGAWTFDAETHLASGAYAAELLAAAQTARLNLFERDGRIACYPMLLTIAAKQMAVLIDRKPEKRLRPGVLVAMLAERQRKP